MLIESRAVLWEDVLELSNTMRPEDRLEIYRQNHFTPFEAVDNSVNNSAISRTALINGKVAAIYGIVPQLVLGRSAWVWMLSSPEIEKAPVEFVKQTRAFFDEMLEIYPVLENWVDASYTRAIKWLKLCGAEFDEARVLGIEKAPHLHFTIKRR